MSGILFSIFASCEPLSTDAFSEHISHFMQEPSSFNLPSVTITLKVQSAVLPFPSTNRYTTGVDPTTKELSWCTSP